MINQFDQATCRAVRTAIDAAMKQVSKDLGIEIDLMGGSFSATEFTMKLKCNTLNSVKTPVVRQGVFGGVAVGHQFKFRGTLFTVIEVNNDKPKYKYIVRNERGTRYKMSAAQVEQGI